MLAPTRAVAGVWITGMGAGFCLAMLGGCRPAGELAAGPVTAAPASAVESPNLPVAMPFPPARRDDVADDYHGTSIADPYRWLEDPNTPETRQWIEAENRHTEAYLAGIAERADFARRLAELWNYPRYGVPTRRGEQLFFTKNDGLQNQGVLYVQQGLDGAPRVLLDPNTLSADGTTSLTGYRPTDDGRLLAYGLADAGSDWQRWRVRDVATGDDLEDDLRWIKFSGVSWTPDGAGFYYSRYDQPNDEASQFTATNYYQKLYYHQLGTPQADDRLVYHRPDEREWGFSGHVTEDGQWLIISVWKGTERANQVFYQDLTQPDAPVVELITGFDAQYDFLGNDGRTFWFRTDRNAPRYRVIAVSVDEPAADHWRELIAESDDVLEDVNVVAERMITVLMRDAQHQVRIHKLDGTLERAIELPGIGSVGGFRGRRDDAETFYAFTSFTTPGAIYRFDPLDGTSRLFRETEFPAALDELETRQVFYISRDGTRVPMFLVHRRGLAMDGRNPTLLYGYGGFNISLTPAFAASRIAWLERGGVFAMPNLRGGGEYGRRWHEAGRLKNKQNVFDDFIAAAEWLIGQGYTSPRHLAIHGRSNGGLLVGACLTQRPELFAAAVPSVGVLDMLRYHQYTIGWAWVPEYGSADDAEMFATLHGYSPLHNIQPGQKYPATLITTADHDDRVVPAHSFKFAAALQAAQGGDAPILIRIETSAGHGAGTSTRKQIEEWTDIFAFMWHRCAPAND